MLLVIGPSATIASFDTNEYQILAAYKKVPTTIMLDEQADVIFTASP